MKMVNEYGNVIVDVSPARAERLKQKGYKPYEPKQPKKPKEPKNK